MALREKQKGLFNQPAPKGEAVPPVYGRYAKPRSRIDLKTLGVIALAFALAYTTLGETMLPYDWRWSTVTGRRAGNQESEALRTATDAKAEAAGAEEAARVAEQVKGEAAKADIQVEAAGEKVFAELPGVVETERQKAQMQLTSSCITKLRDQATVMMAQCLSNKNPEQTCVLERDLFLGQIEERCGASQPEIAQPGGSQ